MSENLTDQYNGYAVYLPSLQQQYAEYATRSNAETTRGKKGIPKNFDTRWLNFFDKGSKLWHCGYTLYSCGQFDGKQITSRDIVAETGANKDCVVVGDSGGFQLGTGKITSKTEKTHLLRYENDPVAQYNNWHRCGFRERTLSWLEKYTDYAMTLDMVLWAHEGFKHPKATDTQLRKLSVQQLIDLSVDNLRYFSDNRGRKSRSTKFLSVLQDIGDGTGEAWYKAVKDFEFEGWALGSKTTEILNSLWWMKRLLEEGKLDKSEWIHVLMKSPPVNSLIYTAAQRGLRKALNRDNFTISMDSSSPIQTAGVNQALVIPPNFTNKKKTWSVSNWRLKQDIRVARNEINLQFPFASPLAKYFSLNDLMAHDKDDSDYFTDTWSLQLLANHNMWAYHRYSIDACDLVFGENKDFERVPEELVELVDLIESYFEAENCGAVEQRLRDVWEAYKSKGMNE